MRNSLELIQLIVTTLALVATAFDNVVRRLFSTGEEGRGQPGADTNTASVSLRGYEDLAVGWASCAVFTLTAGHSIAIAGQNPTASFVPVISMAAGALLVGSIVFSAWRSGRLGRALWLLALASIIVLILGPGGPLNPIEHERGMTLFGVSPSSPYEPPLPYWAALSALVAIFIMGFIVEFPHILDLRRHGGRQLTALLALGLLVVVLSSGASLVQQVLNNPNTPIQLTPAANQWVRRSVQSLSPSDLQQLYRHASEIELQRSYRGRFISSLRELQSTLEQDYDQVDQSRGLRITEKGEVQDAVNIRTRNSTRDLMGTSFLLSEADLRLYIEHRLRWRHPISADGMKSGMVIPGIEPEDREQNLAPIVQRYASAELMRTYGMTPPAPQDESEQAQQRPDQVQGNDAFYYAMRDMFPSLGAYDGRTRLIQQLALPLNYESALSFLTYQQVAVASVGTADAAYRQLRLGADELQTLFEIAQAPSESNPRISLLVRLRQCASYPTLRTDLAMLALARPALVAEGMREIFRDSLDTETSRLVELFMMGSQQRADASTVTDAADTTSVASAPVAGRDTVITRAAAATRARAFASALKQCVNNEQEFRLLFSQGGQAGPASLLLAPNVLDFLEVLGRGGDSPLEREQLTMRYLGSLVSPVEGALLTEVLGSDKRGVSRELTGFLKEFTSLEPERDRRGALHHLAARLYASGGPFSSSVLGSVIGQTYSASKWGPVLSILLATVAVFAAVLIAVLLGLVGGRHLLDRSMLLLQADEEQRSPRQTSGAPPDSPTTFLGRENLLTKLSAFARRGWNTVALVGPRGVGKSELLKTLVRTRPDETSVCIWMQAPTGFEQRVMIAGVKRRLAEALERRISEFAGAAPWSERHLREEAHVISGRIFFVLLAMTAALSYTAFAKAARLDVSAIWLPIGMLGVLAISAWLTASFTLQRQDLRIWLRRSVNANPHLELLYDRCLQELLGFSPTTNRKIRWLRTAQNFVLVAIPVTLIIVSRPVWNTEILMEGLIGGQFGTPSFVFAALMLVGALGIYFSLYLYRRELVTTAQEALAEANTVESYREFVRFCIDRLGEGAIGSKGGNWRVIIAIDELDRLIDVQDLRNAVIQMRGLFEIRGAFYYLSIASDSMRSFHKDDHRTKTEFDSAFDHVESVDPLGFDESKSLVVEYLRSRGVIGTDALYRALALLAFGIPRDAIRYCDSIIAHVAETNDTHAGVAIIESSWKGPELGNPHLRTGSGSLENGPEPMFRALHSLAIRLAHEGESIPTAILEQFIALGYSVWEGECSADDFARKAAIFEQRLKRIEELGRDSG